MKLTRTQALQELGLEEVRFPGKVFRADLLMHRNVYSPPFEKPTTVTVQRSLQRLRTGGGVREMSPYLCMHFTILAPLVATEISGRI